jgi:hypothetical protein
VPSPVRVLDAAATVTLISRIRRVSAHGRWVMRQLSEEQPCLYARPLGRQPSNMPAEKARKPPRARQITD